MGNSLFSLNNLKHIEKQKSNVVKLKEGLDEIEAFKENEIEIENKGVNLKFKSFEEDLETRLIENAYEIILDEKDLESTRDASSAPIKKTKSKSFEKYSQKNIKVFQNQDINNIRKSEKKFVDSNFKPNIKSITESARSQLAQNLTSSLRIQNKFDINELNRKIIWKKSKVNFNYQS